MEKFSRWRDARTGIHPFLHPMPPRTDDIGTTIYNRTKQYLFGPVIALARWLLLAVTAVLWLLAELICYAIMIPHLQWLLRYYLVGSCARLALFFIGVHRVTANVASLRLGRSAADRKESKSDLTRLYHGDILVVNSTGYLDILYLMSRWTPVFTRVHGDRVEVVSFWQALRKGSQTVHSTPTTNVTTLSLEELVRKVKKQRLGPIIVQPEATTSNGRALLLFSPVFRDFNPSEVHSNIRIATFKYPYQYFCPTFSFGHQFIHFFQLCCQYHTPMRITYLAPSKCPTTTPVTVTTSIDDQTSDDLLGEEIATLMGQMSQLRRTQLNDQDKHHFLQFYHQRNQGVPRKK
ncbi:hypothetical protein BDF19DRAFT_449136 [Syncephalis fuscata]|nr:hypothetical protein BDF19DRAFT_449136 [Syncephalis fuscata]